MSQERDTSMELSREDWEEIWPHLRAVMNGAREADLRTSVGTIIATLADFPQARDEFLGVLNNPLATPTSNSLMLFVTLAKKRAFDRAVGRGTRLLEGGYAEWDILDEMDGFWAWCYQGCDDAQREEIAKSLGQRLHFQDGTPWQVSYFLGNPKNAPALLEQLFEEIVENCERFASVDKKDTDHYVRVLLNEALLKSKRRTQFLKMLAVAHGDTQRSALPSEGPPQSDAPSVADISSLNDGRPPADGPSPGHSQQEEAKRKMSLDGESNLSSKRPKIAERRDYDGGNSLSILQSIHEGDKSQEVGRAGTPHPKKELDGVSRHKGCHRLVDWLRAFPHKFRASLNRRMPFLKKLGKGKRSEPSELELENQRKHSSQSRSPGFRGGASLNLSKRRKTGSPAALFLTTKGSLRSAPDQTATSPLHVTDDPSQFRTKKYSPHSLLEMAPSQSPTPQDSPHSSPGSIARPKPRKTQEFVDGGDEEF